ncbi:hypothetical protein LIA77_04325 [Sarocladium implicatum]|nr:hypothetical protein LIA77_04325 [Sarocladium implicatum]
MFDHPTVYATGKKRRTSVQTVQRSGLPKDSRTFLEQLGRLVTASSGYLPTLGTCYPSSCYSRPSLITSPSLTNLQYPGQEGWAKAYPRFHDPCESHLSGEDEAKRSSKAKRRGSAQTAPGKRRKTRRNSDAGESLGGEITSRPTGSLRTMRDDIGESTEKRY